MAKSPTVAKRNKGGRFVTEGKQSPQIFRKITALVSWRLLFALIIVSILLLQLAYFGQTLYRNYQEVQAKQAEKRALEAEVIKWEEVVQEKPNYRDAYFELAVLSYRLNKIDDAKRYLTKVFALDPNFAPARELEQSLAR